MERILALVDGDGVVKNIIVADDTWDYGGIDTHGAVVGIGFVYDFASKTFYEAASSDTAVQNALDQ